jgi:sarcosine oxidase
MTATTHDVIVVGLGAMGAGATYQLAKRGQAVLGLDMYPLGHHEGSSHGHHRMIRRSAVRPELDQMAGRAFELWRELEAESGQNIMNLIGEVVLADSPAGTARHPPHLATVDERQVADTFTYESSVRDQCELLDETALRERFPGFNLREGMVATYEANAGFLRPELGIAAHLEVAEQHGAAIRRPEAVSDWRADGSGVTVITATGTYRADRLVLAAGPWSSELLGDLDLPLQVVRIVNAYFAPTRPEIWTAEHGAPDFQLIVPEGWFYGIPSVEGLGLKIGRHDEGHPTTARTIRRDVDADEIDYLRAVLDEYMPGASGPITHVITCMYTMTPDEQYIVEPHPAFPQVVYGCGCSGSSYKFSGVIGEMLADLALDGSTGYDTNFVSSARFTGA